ncbi:MAG TPA: tail fiber domain-containing protein [Chitinophagaceae bacterium]|jgi:hypothetical protein|nr:tail fiber domain-containing protein [Chitinophagaceae bacterium]
MNSNNLATKLALLVLAIVSCTSGKAQTIGIGTNKPDSNAILDIYSSNKGILMPRTSTESRLKIPAVKGLLVYDTTTNSFWFNDGQRWRETLNGINNNGGVFNRFDTGSNTAFGMNALHHNSGYYNTAIGSAALFENTTAFNNTATGHNVMEHNTTGADNTANGAFGLFNNTTGTGNVTAGFKSMFNNTTGGGNTTMGYMSSFFNSTAVENTTIGFQAGFNNNTSYLVAVGSLSGLNNTSGALNTFVGTSSGRTNSTGGSNTFVGINTGYSSNGSNNTFVGAETGRSNTTGNGNTSLGFRSSFTNTTANESTTIGFQSGFNNNTSFLVAVGSFSGFSNTTGPLNTFIGTSAGRSNTTGGNNTFVGINTGFSSNASNNTFIGTESGKNNTSGNDNTAVGFNSLIANTTGIRNTALGYWTLGTGNGSENVALGYLAMYYTSTGSNNVAVGTSALIGNGTGNKNTVVGHSADVTLGSLQYAGAIGADAKVSCSNCLVLGGNTSTTRTRVGINNSTPVTDLHIIQQSDSYGNDTRGIRIQRSTGNQWRQYVETNNNLVFEYNDNGGGNWGWITQVGTFVSGSDLRIKKNIHPLDDVILEKIMLLQPKSYLYKSQADNDKHSYGFIAQEVQKIFPEFVSEKEDGYLGIAYDNFGVIAVKAIQEQQKQIDLLNKKDNEKQQLIEQLLKRIEILEKK